MPTNSPQLPPESAATNSADNPLPLTFPKRLRLLKSDEFDRVFAGRCSAADKVLVVYALPVGLEHPRLGLVVSRKVGKAVRRNTWKRLLREAFRLHQHELPPLDLVCLPRLRERPTFAAVSASFLRLASKAEAKVQRSGLTPSDRPTSE
ncbi:MAG: ribonuclease P protein component [Planctomycetota bacterium]